MIVPQNARLLVYLETHPRGITQLEAFTALGICRLSERCRELEALGVVLEHKPERTHGGARVIRYILLSGPQGAAQKHGFADNPAEPVLA